MMRLVALYLSSGHSYFGRHGLGAADFPIVEVDELECVKSRGIRGDRFFDHKESYKGQITFFAEEIYEGICGFLKRTDRSRGVFRRNVITSGVDLKELIGEYFEIQGVGFLGTEECRPCAWMDEAFAPGAYDFLRGRGGLRAKILTDGILRKDA